MKKNACKWDLFTVIELADFEKPSKNYKRI